MIFDTLTPPLPRELIKDSGKDCVKMLNSNIINGAKSEIINSRRRLNKRGYIYNTFILYRHNDFTIWKNAINSLK